MKAFNFFEIRRLFSATGTPEAGGLQTRELLHCLRLLTGLNHVGGDVVEGKLSIKLQLSSLQTFIVPDINSVFQSLHATIMLKSQALLRLKFCTKF